MHTQCVCVSVRACVCGCAMRCLSNCPGLRSHPSRCEPVLCDVFHGNSKVALSEITPIGIFHCAWATSSPHSSTMQTSLSLTGHSSCLRHPVHHQPRQCLARMVVDGFLIFLPIDRLLLSHSNPLSRLCQGLLEAVLRRPF